MLRAATRHFVYLHFFPVGPSPSAPCNYRPGCTEGLTARWSSSTLHVSLSLSFFLPSSNPESLSGLQLPSSNGCLQMVPFGEPGFLSSLFFFGLKLVQWRMLCLLAVARMETSKSAMTESEKMASRQNSYNTFLKWLCTFLWAKRGKGSYNNNSFSSADL